MKKKSDGLFLVIFIVVVGIALLYLFQTSYAKYRRNTETTIQGRIASWDIKVNNESINTSTTLTNSITPVIDTNQYVKEGTIAPGSTGHFDIIIDATNVDVDFTYTITGEINEDTPLTDLKITGYKINTSAQQTYNNETGIIGDIPMNTSQTKVTMYFEWDDSPSNEMDNDDDTIYAQTTEYRDTKIDVTIHFEQKR